MESLELQKSRWKRLHLLQIIYLHFVPFMSDMMEFLGFKATELQKDIAEFMETCPNYAMVQAQRG